MGGKTALRAVAASLVLAALPACSSPPADTARPSATVRTEPVTTTTTNPYAVPAVIDVAYVNRVLAGLDAAVGDAVRMVTKAKGIPPEAYDRLKAVYADPDRLQRAIDGLQRDVRNHFIDYRLPPGNAVTVTTQLITSRQTCIFAQVSRDYSTVGTNPLPNLDVQWIGLKPINYDRDPGHLNPTQWTFVYDGFQSDRSQPPNPCVS